RRRPGRRRRTAPPRRGRRRGAGAGRRGPIPPGPVRSPPRRAGPRDCARAASACPAFLLRSPRRGRPGSARPGWCPL
ncbi:HNH endonuclease, partial [Methylobacterium oryzihabitans]